MTLWPLPSEDSKCCLTFANFQKVEITSPCKNIHCDGGATLGTLGAITPQTKIVISNSYYLGSRFSSRSMLFTYDIHLPKQLHVLFLVIASFKHLSLLCLPTSTYSQQSLKHMLNICFNHLSLQSLSCLLENCHPNG